MPLLNRWLGQLALAVVIALAEAVIRETAKKR